MPSKDRCLHKIKRDQEVGALLFAGSAIAVAPVSVLPPLEANVLIGLGLVLLATSTVLLGRTCWSYVQISATESDAANARASRQP
ncbi:MAG: hypothetical protein AAGE01_15460 [Pseudomonadota bacterium]